jgi:hypothetical protein
VARRGTGVPCRMGVRCRTGVRHQAAAARRHRQSQCSPAYSPCMCLPGFRWKFTGARPASWPRHGKSIAFVVVELGAQGPARAPEGADVAAQLIDMQFLAEGP